MKRTFLTTLGIAALAVAVSTGFVALVVAATNPQVPDFGLPGRYSAAFTGAGIETGALLGPFCKSASASGNTLSIVCEDDDDPSNADATTTFTPTDVSVSSAALAGTTATFTKSDSSTFDLNLSTLGGGGGGNTEAIVGVAYDQSENAFTFTTAGGATITCDLDADCPAPASQTIYVGTRALDNNFVPTDFTTSGTGNTATGSPPLAIAIPATADSGHKVAWALPASLTLTSFFSIQEQCGFLGFDCGAGVDITISGSLYKFYAPDATVTELGRNATINWTE